MHALYLLDVCWTFAGRLLNRVNGVLVAVCNHFTHVKFFFKYRTGGGAHQFCSADSTSQAVGSRSKGA